jgi:hypothetical protein
MSMEHVVAHGWDGDDVVIMEGTAIRVTDREEHDRLERAWSAKYVEPETGERDSTRRDTISCFGSRSGASWRGPTDELADALMTFRPPTVGGWRSRRRSSRMPAPLVSSKQHQMSEHRGRGVRRRSAAGETMLG